MAKEQRPAGRDVYVEGSGKESGEKVKWLPCDGIICPGKRPGRQTNDAARDRSIRVIGGGMMERCNTRGLPVVIAAFICELFRTRYSIISRAAVIHYRRVRIPYTRPSVSVVRAFIARTERSLKTRRCDIIKEVAVGSSSSPPRRVVAATGNARLYARYTHWFLVLNV